MVKYVTRWKLKGGISDLKKAKHYLDLLIEYTQKNEPAWPKWAESLTRAGEEMREMRREMEEQEYKTLSTPVPHSRRKSDITIEDPAECPQSCAAQKDSVPARRP